MTGYELIVLAVRIVLGGIGLRLLVIDARTHRLPNRIVLPVGVAVLALVVVDALVRWTPTALLRATAGMLVLGLFYAALNLAGGGVGGGDVKLAAVIGLVLGWHGWTALLIGAAAAFVLGAVWALVLIALRRADRRTRIAFGPWMILGAALGVIAGVLER